MLELPNNTLNCDDGMVPAIDKYRYAVAKDIKNKESAMKNIITTMVIEISRMRWVAPAVIAIVTFGVTGCGETPHH
jgi:hypothetical protein